MQGTGTWNLITVVMTKMVNGTPFSRLWGSSDLGGPQVSWARPRGSVDGLLGQGRDSARKQTHQVPAGGS